MLDTDEAVLLPALKSREPELLEVRNGLEYTWYAQSPDKVDWAPLDKAYATALVTATRDGERVGYLRIAYTTDELVAAVFADPLTYFRNHRGWGFDPDGDRVAIWKTFHLHAQQTPKSLKRAGRNVAYWSLTNEHGEHADIEADLAGFAQEARKAIAAWADGFPDPIVAYSKAEERRQRIGATLYELGARKLAEWGHVLRASTLCSDEAQALWRFLVASPEYPTTTRMSRGTTPQELPALDYR